MIDNGTAQAVKIFHCRNRKEAPLYKERGTALAQVGTQRVGRFHRLSGGWVNTF